MSFSPVVTTHDINEVASFLKKSKASIYSDLTRNPKSLPPTMRVPGSARVLFVNLHAWAAGLIQLPAATPPSPHEFEPTRKKRGRPSNLEKKRREEEKNGGNA